MTNEITKESLKQFDEDNNNNWTSLNAVANNGFLAASENQTTVNNNRAFSIELKTKDVTDQKRSGRCWMFAALNSMRHDIIKKSNLPQNFQLSQSYTFFWDKLEKSNYFYNNIIATANKPLDDRKVSFLLETPQQDGGQWDMICAIIEKYGIVPRTIMPETFNSANSDEINTLLNKKLRKDAIQLRKLVKEADDKEISKFKQAKLTEVYRMLVLAFGKPVEKFDFEYKDADNNYHIDRNLTPKSFYDKYIGWNLQDYVSIINAPTSDKKYNHTYTVEFLGNVVGGRQVKHLNVDIEDFKKLAIKQLQDGQPVWFGCDVLQESDRQLGIMDLNTYDKDNLLNINLSSMSKAERLDYHESLMTHAMLLTGVDLVDGKPTKWKVENSWGKKVGDKGYFVMSNEWLEEYCYQIVIRKDLLPNSLRKAQEEKPEMLKPWDPMGALA